MTYTVAAIPSVPYRHPGLRRQEYAYALCRDGVPVALFESEKLASAVALHMRLAAKKNGVDSNKRENKT
jgi:hypothetical protein